MSFLFKLCILVSLLGIQLWGKLNLAQSHSIYFSGQKSMPTKDLEEALGVKNKSFYAFWKKNNPRIDDNLIETLDASLDSFYKSEGFYDANFSIEKNTSSIRVQINENKPIRVNDVNISSDYNLSLLVDFQKGDIFKASHFIEIKKNIIKKLLEEGYCSYDLDTKAYVDLDAHEVSIEYILSKGGICTFGELNTTGLETIDLDIVKSLLRAKKGQRFTTQGIQETKNNLYALEAFDSVRIRTDRKIYNVIPVDIVFKEKEKPYHFELGAGYDTYVGYRVHTEVTKYNFLDNAQKLQFKAGWSKKEQLLVFNYFKPVFFTLFEYQFDLGASLGYSNLEFDGFQEEKAFSKAYLSYKASKIKLELGLSTEKILITNLDNLNEGESLEQAVNTGNFVLFYPYIDFVYDARDSKLNPKYGYYFSLYSEIGLANEKDASVYYKTLLEGRLIYTWNNLTLSSVGRVGIIDESSDTGLPESKYFFAGGSYSNRAYGYRELGVIVSPTEDSINGASSLLNLSLEMNYPLWGNIYGAVFWDNTMLNEKSYDFTGDIFSSVGIGVRYMTAIGPLKLDIAMNSQESSQYAITFQIGQSF